MNLKFAETLSLPPDAVTQKFAFLARSGAGVKVVAHGRRESAPSPFLSSYSSAGGDRICQPMATVDPFRSLDGEPGLGGVHDGLHGHDVQMNHEFKFLTVQCKSCRAPAGEQDEFCSACGKSHRTPGELGIKIFTLDSIPPDQIRFVQGGREIGRIIGVKR